MAWSRGTGTAPVTGEDPRRGVGPQPQAGTSTVDADLRRGRACTPTPGQTPTRLAPQDEPPGQTDTLLCQQGTRMCS